MLSRYCCMAGPPRCGRPSGWPSTTYTNAAAQIDIGQRRVALGRCGDRGRRGLTALVARIAPQVAGEGREDQAYHDGARDRRQAAAERSDRRCGERPDGAGLQVAELA